MSRSLWFSLVILTFVFVDFSSADDSITTPTFANTTCSQKICVGFVSRRDTGESAVEFYIYKHRSYSEDDNTISGDNYLVVTPLDAELCDGTTPCTTLNLQQAQPFSLSPTRLLWNDALGLSVNYTINSTDTNTNNQISLLIQVYLLSYATTVKEDDTKFRISPGDFVIKYSWNGTSETTNSFKLRTQISHGDANCIVSETNDYWKSFQFSEDCTEEGLIGYQLAAPLDIYINGASIPATVNTTNSTASIISVELSIPGGAYDGSYTMVVATGKNTFFIWMVTLVVSGGILLLILIPGIVIYVIREKRKTAAVDSLPTY